MSLLKKYFNFFIFAVVFGTVLSTTAPSYSIECGTSAAQLQLKEYTDSCASNQVQDIFAVVNNGAPVTLSDIKIKFWIDETSGNNITGSVFYGGCLMNPSCFHTASGVSIGAVHFSLACGSDSTHQANWEVTVSTTDNTILSGGVSWTNIQTSIHRIDFQDFSPTSSSWYSRCVGNGNYTADTHYAIYLKGNLVTASGGIPPLCRAPATCTPTLTPTKTKTPTPTFTRTPTKTFTPTPTPTNTFTPTFTFTPTPNLTPDPRSFLIRPWAVGQTVSYSMKIFNNENQVDSFNVIYSIVGQETVNNNLCFWIEREEDRSNGMSAIKKIQVRQPGATDFENILDGNYQILRYRRKISEIKLSFLPDAFSPVEYQVPSDAINRVDNGPEPSETDNLGSEYTTSFNKTVVVPAGSFQATEFYRTFDPEGTSTKSPDTNSQFMDDYGSVVVPIFGEIKRTFQTFGLDNVLVRYDLELTSYSLVGATTKIIATPTPISDQGLQEAVTNFFLAHPEIPNGIQP